MPRPEYKNPVDIRGIIEHQPFSEPATQSFLAKWCTVNDSIVPQFVSRSKWSEQIKNGMLIQRPDGKKDLVIPDDVHLWELVGIVEAVDRDTFVSDPDKPKEKAEQLREFGKTLRSAGVYIAQRLDGITIGSRFAEEMAKELFRYGNNLNGSNDEQGDITIEGIQSNTLTAEETNTVDTWLAGPKLYQSRMRRLRGKEDDAKAREELRQKTLQQFFRAAERAMKLQAKGADRNESFYAPIHSKFLDTIESNLRLALEKPKREFITTFFRRGIEKLAHEMKDPDDVSDLANDLLGTDEFKKPYETLRQALRIDELKKELTDLRKTVSPELVAKREMEIALKIRNKLLRLPYQSGANNPSEMIANQEINCLGGCLLAGALFKELGIDFLQATLPDHAILFPVTKTGRIFYFDFVNKDVPPTEITDDDIHGKNINGSDLHVADLIRAAKDPDSYESTFNFISEKFLSYSSGGALTGELRVAASHPESGQETVLLSNFAITLGKLGFHKEAIHLKNELITRQPHNERWYILLYYEYLQTGESTLAWDTIKKGLLNVPNSEFFYLTAFHHFRNEGKLEESITLLERGITKATTTEFLYRILINDLLNRRGDVSKILQIAEENVQKNENTSTAYEMRGIVYEKMNQFAQALDDYDKAIELSPKDITPHLKKANLLKIKGSYWEALLEYSEVKSLALEQNRERLVEIAANNIIDIGKLITSSN